MLPVLIGSRGLYEYGTADKFEDVDLVVNNDIAGSLYLKCDESKGKMLWYGKMKVDLHLTTAPSNLLLFNTCNNSVMVDALIEFGSPSIPFVCRKITIDPIGEVLLPPLELLYVVLKSHIHRILELTPYQHQNVKIWMKHMSFYKKIRDCLSYNHLDSILYREYLGDWRDCTGNGSLDDLMRNIYQMRFNETNKRIGDTVISLDKSEKDFFKDNVERFVDHDELHSQVGISFRENPEPLFKKYQTDPSKVDLDREVFIKASQMERIEILREEIMVLLLERKWIPEVIKCYKEAKIPYVDYDLKEKAEELVEVGANYITNLCGQGDAWLRRFCLDHSHLLLDAKMYDFDKLKELTLKVTKYESKCEEIKDKDLLKKIAEYEGLNKEYIEFFLNMIDKSNFKEPVKEYEYFYFNNNVPTTTINFVSPEEIKWYDKDVKFKRLSLGPETNKTIMAIVHHFQNDYNLGVEINDDSFTIYNLVNNIGIYYNTDTIKVFTLTMKMNNDTDVHNYKKFQIEGSYIDMFGSDRIDFANKFIRKCKSYYYHSDDCTEQLPNHVKTKFLANYGSAPDFMKKILEVIARRYLKLPNSDDYMPSDAEDSEDSGHEW